LDDVKFATIEPNGLLGYELNEDAKPLTVGEFKKLLALNSPLLQNVDQQQHSPSEKGDIFEEIHHETPQNYPDYLN